MDQGWFRLRAIALTAAALAVLAVVAQFGESAAVANIPPPDVNVAIRFFPTDEKLLATAWWIVQGALATVALGFGIAAALQKPGRTFGVVATGVALVVLVV